MASTSVSVVMIESPYSGDIDRNVRYLSLATLHSGTLGELPYSSHSYMTHPRAKNFFVSDYDPKWDVWTRDQAIERSHVMRHRCDRTVFYTDLGWSSHMKAAKKYCVDNNLPFEERTVDLEAVHKQAPFISVKFSGCLVSGCSHYDEFLE